MPANNGTNIAHISPGATGSGSVGKLTMANLTINGGDLTLDLATNATPGTTYDFINVTGSLTLPVESTPGASRPSGGAGAGVYTVMTAGVSNIGSDAALPTVNDPAAIRTFARLRTRPSFSGNSLPITVAGGAAGITWSGESGSGGNGSWDINNTTNWNDSSRDRSGSEILQRRLCDFR